MNHHSKRERVSFGKYIKSLDQFGCNINISKVYKTKVGGVMTFLCFGILIGYSIYQLIQAYNATL